MPSSPRGRLSRIPAGLLAEPVTTLGLGTRTLHCVSDVTTVAELLRLTESDLMSRRNFGAACLADVRRQLARFALDALDALEGPGPLGTNGSFGEDSDGGQAIFPRSAARAAAEPFYAEAAAAWETPAQPRPIAEVLEEVLELLARSEELPRASASARGPGRKSLWSPSPAPVPPRATLKEVSDCLFSGLKPRERELLEVRFGADAARPPTLAVLGEKLGVSRERVRQVMAAALQRIAQPEACIRRRPVTEHLLRAFRGAGGVLKETAVADALRRRFPGNRAASLPVSRIILATTPPFVSVSEQIWTAEVPAASVAELLDTLHRVLRSCGGALTPQQVAVCLREQQADAGAPDGLVAGCLAADARFRQFEGGRFGLREWAWGIPASLEEQLSACLRSLGKPESTVRLMEAVNRILPPEQPGSYAQVIEALSGSDVFRRVGSGTYALSEWLETEREGE